MSQDISYKEFKEFLNLCESTHVYLMSAERDEIYEKFEDMFLHLPGSVHRKEFEDLKEKYGCHLLKRETGVCDMTPQEKEDLKEAQSVFDQFITKLKHEYCFNKMQIFRYQVQLHNILERDHEEFDPYDRYLSEGIKILPWEHYEFRIKGSTLNHENLIQCSIMNGIILQGLLFRSDQHVEDLFAVFENKQAPIALRAHAFVGACLLIGKHAALGRKETKFPSSVKTHFIDEGEFFLYLYLKAFYLSCYTKITFNEAISKLENIVKKFKAIKHTVQEDYDRFFQESADVAKNTFDVNYMTFDSMMQNPPTFLYDRYDLRFMNNWMLPFSFEHPSVVKHQPKYLKSNQEKYIKCCDANHICDLDRYIIAVTPKAPTHDVIKAMHITNPLEENSAEMEINKFIMQLQRFFDFYKTYPQKELAHLNPFIMLAGSKPDHLFFLLKNVAYIKDLFLTINEVDKDSAGVLMWETIPAWEKNIETMEIITDHMKFTDVNFNIGFVCKKLLAVDPKNKKAAIKLIQYSMKLEKYGANDGRLIPLEHIANKEEQLELAEMLEQNYPEDQDVMDTACLLYYHAGMYDKAIKTLHRSIFYFPQDEDYMYDLTEMYLLSGRKEEAFKYARKMLDEQEESAENYVRAGHTALAMGNRELAMEWYREGIEREYKAKAEEYEIPLEPKDKTLLKESLELIEEEPELLEPYGITSKDLHKTVQELYKQLIN